MKSTKKIVSVLLSALMLAGSVSTALTVNASTGGTLCSKYATNPNGQVGKQGSITIDGSFSDWSKDMLIAQGAAWDVANHYKGGHENCVLDTYALFASWDSSNLYLGWQMVNTTDTWAREGDGPLSDGGRVLDVPLILALSVDPSSTSMSNKNSDGGPIWGQKMGLEFEQHVDHLFYMSGKPGLGQPAMFTAVDAEGNTNYTTGCNQFAAAGIEYKMAEGNICDSIFGLDYSEDPNDVYNDDANWVDYKTFKGSSGTHNTSYDSFYEIKIPLAKLGIDANYLATNGIGAMVVATRGESALDCIPFDDTMLDNATGEYGNDPSTSHEKDDIDIITSEFAKIGKGGPVIPTQPSSNPTEPSSVTTEPSSSEEPTTSMLQLKAESNVCGSSETVTYDPKTTKTVTVTYNLKSAMDIVNGQWNLTYNTAALSFDPAKNQAIMPYVTDAIIRNGNGVIKGNFSNIDNLYNFKTAKEFVQVTFDVIGAGVATVALTVDELSVGYNTADAFAYKNAVVNGTLVDLSGVAGFENSAISGTSKVSTSQPVTNPTTQPTSSSSDVKYSDFQLRGNITLALNETSYSANVLTGTVDLPAGSYKFVVQDTANDIAYGRAASYTDTISKGFFGNGWGYCTLKTTGGKYTFTFNKNNKQVNVTCDSSIKSNLSTYKLRGSINSALVKTSDSNIIKNTVALPAGDYRFVLTDDATKISYGRHEAFSGSIGRALCGNNWGYVEFTAETTGVYEFVYNTKTNQVTVLPVTSNSADYALVGSNIGFKFDKTTTANVITKTVNLKAGTYTFGVSNDNGASYIGRPQTYTDSISNALCGKGWGLVTLNITKAGSYKFTFNTKSNAITVAAV